MLWRVFQLLFMPSSFANSSVNHDASESVDKDQYLIEAKARIRKKRKGFLVSFIVVFLVVGCGFGAAELTNKFGNLPNSFILIIRVLSISIVAWSVLGRLGYETETIKGKSLLEKTSLFSFKFFYCFGLFLAVCGKMGSDSN